MYEKPKALKFKVFKVQSITEVSRKRALHVTFSISQIFNKMLQDFSTSLKVLNQIPAFRQQCDGSEHRNGVALSVRLPE